MTFVFNLSTYEERHIDLPPEEAVIEAYNSKNEDNKLEGFVPKLVYGEITVACGNWCALINKESGARHE